MRDKIIGFIISVVFFIISFGFVKGQAMALPFVPTDWTWEMYQGLHMLGDLIANDVNFEVPDWVDFNDFDDVKLFLENIYNEGKKKVAYASIIADLCVGTWEHFLVTGEVDLGFSEQNIKRVHNTGFFQHIVDTISIDNIIVEPDPNYQSYLDTINGHSFGSVDYGNCNPYIPLSSANGYSAFLVRSAWHNNGDIGTVGANNMFIVPQFNISITSVSDNVYRFTIPFHSMDYSLNRQANYYYFVFAHDSLYNLSTSQSYMVNQYSFENYYRLEDITREGTLDYLLSYLSTRVRNCNIFVDGQLWSFVGDTTVIDNPLGVVIPDNTIDDIQVGDTKGHIISATLPDTDNLVGSIDLGVVMDELREAQSEGRQASLEKVKTKEGVKAIDGTVVDTKSKAVAIDVPVVTSVVASADDFGYIPYYPEIPSAFSGTTILSELIDATQTIVPNDLIMAIWGLVIILFIIALINIFHK